MSDSTISRPDDLIASLHAEIEGRTGDQLDVWYSIPLRQVAELVTYIDKLESLAHIRDASDER